MNISFENHHSISNSFFYVLGSVDIMLSHDWPNGITDYGNVEQLLRFKRFFADDIQNNRLGSKPAMDILKYLKPKQGCNHRGDRCDRGRT